MQNNKTRNMSFRWHYLLIIMINANMHFVCKLYHIDIFKAVVINATLLKVDYIRSLLGDVHILVRIVFNS